MSLFAPSETVPKTGVRAPVRSIADLVGKGLQRLSYQVESKFVQRKFKNHLKRLGIFSPNYRKSDREQVFLHSVQRRFEPGLSNRQFKKNWLRQFGSCAGLKCLPRHTVAVTPLHVGTIHHSAGKFYLQPSLARRRSLPVWAVRLRAWARAKIGGEHRKVRAKPEGNGSGQSSTNPVDRTVRAESLLSRPVTLTSNSVRLLGGQTFPSREHLFDRFPNGEFRYFVLQGERIVCTTNPYLWDPAKQGG